MNTHTHIYIHTHTHTHIHTYIHIYIHTRTTAKSPDLNLNKIYKKTTKFLESNKTKIKNKQPYLYWHSLGKTW